MVQGGGCPKKRTKPVIDPCAIKESSTGLFCFGNPESEMSCLSLYTKHVGQSPVQPPSSPVPRGGCSGHAQRRHHGGAYQAAHTDQTEKVLAPISRSFIPALRIYSSRPVIIGPSLLRGSFVYSSKAPTIFSRSSYASAMTHRGRPDTNLKRSVSNCQRLERMPGQISSNALQVRAKRS